MVVTPFHSCLPLESTPSTSSSALSRSVATTIARAASAPASLPTSRAHAEDRQLEVDAARRQPGRELLRDLLHAAGGDHRGAARRSVASGPRTGRRGQLILEHHSAEENGRSSRSTTGPCRPCRAQCWTGLRIMCRRREGVNIPFSRRLHGTPIHPIEPRVHTGSPPSEEHWCAAELA
jgi:hypothetical protein